MVPDLDGAYSKKNKEEENEHILSKVGTMHGTYAVGSPKGPEVE